MEHVEVARAESERGEVVLRERHDPEQPDGPHALELRVNGVFVMDTLETATEQQLAAAALARVDEPRSVVIGGLGLGFTLREVLADKRVERVAVVEIEGALVRWMRDGTVPHGRALLTDPRVEVAVGDVRRVIEDAAPSSLDLVLLDVDNRPGYLVHDANRAIYGRDLLEAARRALGDHGLCVVWSAAHDASLDRALREVFGHAEAAAYDVDLQGRAEQYWLHLGGVRSTT